MTPLRGLITEAMNGAYDSRGGTSGHERHDQHKFYYLCHVCQGDVNKLAEAVRAALVKDAWPRLVVIAKLEEIAAQYPEHVFTPDGTLPDAIAGTAIRQRMLAEIRMLRERAEEWEADDGHE